MLRAMAARIDRLALQCARAISGSTRQQVLQRSTGPHQQARAELLHLGVGEARRHGQRRARKLHRLQLVGRARGAAHELHEVLQLELESQAWELALERWHGRVELCAGLHAPRSSCATWGGVADERRSVRVHAGVSSARSGSATSKTSLQDWAMCRPAVGRWGLRASGHTPRPCHPL